MEKGSSYSSSSSAGGADSFNGLKFGKKIYFEGVGSGLQPRIGVEEELEEAAPPRSPAKKGRTAVEPPRCQVEGCDVDLTGAKAYYCRHKVCGLHSKSPMVIVAGLEQRFCQQCSRFHQLPEFDQGKRSCRRRLAGHNERRRKPPPGPLLSSRYAALSPSIFDSWPSTTKREPATNYELPWQSSPQPPLPPSLLQGSATRPSYSSEDCFAGISSDSSSALSLLSNWGSTTQSLDLGVNNFVGAGVAQPSLHHPSWDFKADDDDNSLSDMGLPQALGLARSPDQQQGYDSSVHHMKWSL